MGLNLIGAALAAAEGLPPVKAAGYEYLVAANGLMIRAEDSRMSACLMVAHARLRGLAHVVPDAQLKLPRIPCAFLWSLLASARRHLPNERAFQFTWEDGAWRCAVPFREATPTTLQYADNPAAVVDLHSHGELPAFFSETDDGDEQGLRFYVVIGEVGSDAPTITARVGVYGHHRLVPAATIFDGLGPFVEANDAE